MLAPHAITRRRVRLTQQLRQFFWAADFSEVDTFVAIRAPAPEPGIRPVEVSLRQDGISGDHRGGLPSGLPSGLHRYLQTSPELGMKRLLAGGWEKIFQLATVFRDGDLGPWHRPEFRLLEWYRRGASWHALMDDCEGLLASLTGGAPTLVWQGRRIDLTRPFPRLSMEELFVRHAGFSILAADSRPRLRACLRAAAIHHSALDSWSDLFHRAFIGRVQPALAAMDRPVFVTHFPRPEAALARLCAEDTRAAERFEWLIAGCELANGFGELTCSDVQRERFIACAAAKAASGERVAPLDEAFLAELAHLPASAGCAVGWERLLMVLCDSDGLAPLEFVPWETT